MAASFMRTVISRVPIRGLQADVSEPASDHNHLDVGLEEMDGRHVPKHVRHDPTCGRCRGGFESRGILPHLYSAERRSNTEHG